MTDILGTCAHFRTRLRLALTRAITNALAIIANLILEDLSAGATGIRTVDTAAASSCHGLGKLKTADLMCPPTAKFETVCIPAYPGNIRNMDGGLRRSSDTIPLKP